MLTGSDEDQQPPEDDADVHERAGEEDEESFEESLYEDGDSKSHDAGSHTRTTHLQAMMFDINQRACLLSSNTLFHSS